jgi:transcriptional regulator with XRE-family HTH domain
MSSIDREIGFRLKIARKAAGFKTAISFAQKMRIAKSTFSQHENGTRSLTAEQIIFYSDTLQIDPSWLLTGNGHPCPTDKNKEVKKAYIEKEVNLLIEDNQLPATKNSTISMENNSATVNMPLFSKIIILSLAELSKNNVHIQAEELVKFCISMYNSIEFLNSDESEKDSIINLSIKSMMLGNKIVLKKTAG